MKETNTQLSSILITLSFSLLKESAFFDCFMPGSVILPLPALDTQGDVILALWTLSDDDTLGPSETGDLIDSLFGCLPSETLIARGIHFELVDFSLSSTESFERSQVLNAQIHILDYQGI